VPEPRELTPNASAAQLFGAELRHQRQRHGLSLERLCAVVAGHGYRTVPGYVSNVEAGARLPQQRRFAEICDAALESGGVLGRLWDYADAERHRDRAQRARQREAVLEFAVGALAPVVSGEAVYVPVVTAVDSIVYVKLTRRAFLAYGAALAGSVGVLTPDELDRLTLALDQPRRADEDVADYFRQMLVVQKAYDYRVSPAAHLGPVGQQVAVLDRLCQDAKKPARSALRSVQSEYAEYLGWLHQQIGNTKAAVYWTEKAMVWAQSSGDYQFVSFAIGRKTNLAVWAGRPAEAMELADTGRRVPWRVPPGLASINAQYEARALALRGDEAGTLRLLEDARGSIKCRERSGEDRIYWAQRHTESFLDATEAHCRIDLGRPADAIEILREFVPSGEPQPRQAGPLALLALAHARAGDPEAAAEAGQRALAAPLSANTSRVLATAEDALRTWAGETYVQDFRRRLAEQRVTRRDTAI
jgi:transcriptional regulator with XRE-family HTH domain